MQQPSEKDPSKASKFKVFMLSDADVAFLNNEAPKTFDEGTNVGLESKTEANAKKHHISVSKTNPDAGQTTVLSSSPSASHKTDVNQQMNNGSYIPDAHSLFKNENKHTDELLFSSVPETTPYKTEPEYDSTDLNDILFKVIASEPLLTEDDLLFLVKKEYSGQLTISRRILRQALEHNGLQDGYKRLQAYITGK